MNCQNCKSQITCGCQVRTASDGNKVCSNCISTYEMHLKDKKKENLLQPNNPNEKFT